MDRKDMQDLDRVLTKIINQCLEPLQTEIEQIKRDMQDLRNRTKKPLLSESEVAAYMGVSVKTVSGHRNRGELPFTQVTGGSKGLRYFQKDVDELVNKHYTGQTKHTYKLKNKKKN